MMFILCPDEGWAMRGSSHLPPTLFPHFLPTCMGEGWALPGFSHLSPTPFPHSLPLSWAKGGICVAFPIFLPPFPHTSYHLHGRRVGIACSSHPSSTKGKGYTLAFHLCFIFLRTFGTSLSDYAGSRHRSWLFR